MSDPNDSSLYVFDDAGALLETQLPLPRKSGKVRDVYDLGESLLIVSTDRISAFDYILPCGIPEKGKLLTSMSSFWFEKLGVRHHLISTETPASLSSQYDVELPESLFRFTIPSDVEVVLHGEPSPDAR